MSDNREGTAFDNWYNGNVGFHINSERILDDLQPKHKWSGYGLDPLKLEKWMKVCWNNALEAASTEVQHICDYIDKDGFLQDSLLSSLGSLKAP